MLNLDPKDVAIIKHHQESRDFVSAGAKVIALTEMGWKRTEIAESLSVAPMTLRNWANAAKSTGVHADFTDLTPKNRVMERNSNYTNHGRSKATRKFSPQQIEFLQYSHSTSKSTRQWVHFKGLLTYLLSIKYPVSHISKALNTSNSHIQTLLTTPESNLISEFHSLSFQPTISSEKFFILHSSPQPYLLLTVLRPTQTALFTPESLTDLHPEISTTPFPVPEAGQRVIMEDDMPYSITHHDAVRFLGIMNEKKEVL